MGNSFGRSKTEKRREAERQRALEAERQRALEAERQREAKRKWQETRNIRENNVNEVRTVVVPCPPLLEQLKTWNDCVRSLALINYFDERITDKDFDKSLQQAQRAKQEIEAGPSEPKHDFKLIKSWRTDPYGVSAGNGLMYRGLNAPIQVSLFQCTQCKLIVKVKGGKTHELLNKGIITSNDEVYTDMSEAEENAAPLVHGHMRF